MVGTQVSEQGIITLQAYTTIEKGQPVSLNANGLAIPSPAGTSDTKVLGFALDDALAGALVAVITLRGSVVLAKLDPTNSAIVPGDTLSVDSTQGGVVDKATSGGVALALEAKAANVGGLIRCMIV